MEQRKYLKVCVFELTLRLAHGHLRAIQRRENSAFLKIKMPFNNKRYCSKLGGNITDRIAFSRTFVIIIAKFYIFKKI